MPRLFDDESSREFFTDKYARVPSEAALRVEAAVLGHAEGLSGYTTAEQASVLCERINVQPGARVLDLGAGRGWPGSFVAKRAQCRLVFADLPVGALNEALQRLKPGEPEARASAVAADGRALPFRSETFEAIVHADAF